VERFSIAIHRTAAEFLYTNSHLIVVNLLDMFL